MPGKSVQRVIFRSLMGLLAVCSLSSTIAAAQVIDPKWGNYYAPFAADSLWNSRPVAPVFGTFVIPKSDYYPAIASGAFSTGMFLSKATDGPMVIKPPSGKSGVWDPDAEITRPTVTIPHWPADVLPAAGGDGHADIVDPDSGIIHSFWQLKKQLDGQWTAELYAWTRLAGRGWADPAHYYQGARAAAVPASAGLIRKHEINDGQAVYRHALAMSMTFNGLSPKPPYIFPATSADFGAETQNTGSIPEGALVMLPPAYNTAQIANPALRKVAETLKQYGAYIVDRNHGTPFYIYVENGGAFDLHKGSWDNAVAMELDRMRGSLRQVVSASGWLDGNGVATTPQKNLNVLSMRGPWQRIEGTVSGTFDTWAQAVVFPTTSARTVQANGSSRGLSKITWAVPKVGSTQRLAVYATGGAKLRLHVYSGGTKMFDSGELSNGQAARFVWPSAAWIAVYAISGVGQPSSVRGELIAVVP